MTHPVGPFLLDGLIPVALYPAYLRTVKIRGGGGETTSKASLVSTFNLQSSLSLGIHSPKNSIQKGRELKYKKFKQEVGRGRWIPLSSRPA